MVRPNTTPSFYLKDVVHNIAQMSNEFVAFALLRTMFSVRPTSLHVFLEAAPSFCFETVAHDVAQASNKFAVWSRCNAVSSTLKILRAMLRSASIQQICSVCPVTYPSFCFSAVTRERYGCAPNKYVWCVLTQALNGEGEEELGSTRCEYGTRGKGKGFLPLLAPAMHANSTAKL